jgi:alkylhydroperoxidase family enzyme
MTWLTQTAEGSTEFDRVLGLCPAAAERSSELWDEIYDSAADPIILELCRLRIGMLHGSKWDLAHRAEAAVAAGLAENQIDALPAYPTSPLFTDQQRRCLAFAEQYAMDVHGLTDDDFAGVADTMTAAEMTAFTFALGMFDGMARFRALLDVAAD